jgi:2-polyprenyl-3-methyl-5-hydroxy-6-metoxy-1,4-benzoquinol methylase
VQVDEASLPGPEQEKKHHLAHQAHVQGDAYQSTLRRLALPLFEHAQSGEDWLDFGCGPGRPLEPFAHGAGVRLAAYDPLFVPDPHVLQRKYAGIACSETAEHFHHPGRAFDQLQELLQPGGWLGILTWVLRDPGGFSGWRYADDFTHVCFYQPKTWLYMAARQGWELAMPDPNVALFHKPAAALSPGNS